MRTIDLASALERFGLLREFAKAATVADAHVWLVGGVVRDALLGRATKDADLVTDGDPGVIAASVGRTARAAVVHLYDDPPTYRVVKNGVEHDITGLRAATLADDLRARDLTINAMAVELGGDGGVIDPTNGLADLEGRRIRGITPENFAADPLRALRVYRFAAELDFDIDPDTRRWCADVAARLKDAANERIWDETRRLLATRRAATALRFALEDSVTRHVFLDANDRIHAALPIVDALDHGAHDDAITLKLAVLDWTRDEGDSRPLIAETLSTPTRTRKAVHAILAHRNAPSEMRKRFAGGENERRAMADYFLQTREYWLAVAHVDTAARIAAGEENAIESLAHLRELFRNHVEPVIAAPLLTGNDLMYELGWEAGPRIGRALDAIVAERIAGTVTNRKEAIEFLRAQT